jgi:cytochrome c553
MSIQEFRGLACVAALAGIVSLGVLRPAIAAEAAAGNATAGAAKAAVCAACHGITGNSANPEWPNLAGQHAGYIVEQLTLFKGAVRSNAIMQGQAVTLSAADMADVAAYFEKQVPAGLEADATLWKTGEKLYRGGDAGRGIPACGSCHGPNGRGNGPAKWPQIRAQHAVYVTAQLRKYTARARYVAVAGQPAPPAAAEMMYDAARRLSEDDIKALAAYIQGLR